MNRLTAVLLSIAFAIATPGPAFANGLDNLVKIDSGVVAGSGTDVRFYKGIPFAAPPVGALRWRAPEPPKPWQGVRVAKNFAPPCAQAPLPTQPVAEQKSSEDCLALNVWTPAKNANDKLPVLVWIHGGGFFAGTSSSTAYDGESFAKQGIVYVSINYRLGLFGFLAHPELSKESPRGTSGNYALQDMIAALQWIKGNIGAFGGDPDNVTIWGESAGGTAAALLMVAPDAKGLFHKAIASSAWSMYQPLSHRTQSRYGRLPAEHAGEKLGTLAALRALSTDEVNKLRSGIEFNSDGEHTGEIYYHIVDGVTVPDDPALLFENGKFHAVPLLAGTVADEGTLFARNMRKLDQVNSWIARAINENAIVSLQKQYDFNTDAQASAAFANIFGDAAFTMGTRAILRATAKAQPQVFQYQFTRVAGFGKRSRLGAFHASELGYSFATLPDSPYGTFGVFAVQATDFNDTDKTLSNAMHGAYARFVKTGDPNGGDLALWPAFKAGDESYLEFGDTIAIKKELHKARLDALDAIYKAKRAKAKSK
jgi:para-nitrobenzyl esterase